MSPRRMGSPAGRLLGVVAVEAAPPLALEAVLRLPYLVLPCTVAVASSRKRITPLLAEARVPVPAAPGVAGASASM